MCASYMIKQRNPSHLHLPYDLRIDDFEQYLGTLIVPHRNAPVIRRTTGGPEIVEMKFSLLPSWSKDPKVKFATHNARLETIDEKPTWKKVFIQKHCLVPLSDFIEPIYENEFAGKMVAFSAADDTIMLAAGVWDEWVNKETGEVIPSFSIITHDPPHFIENIGHDRCPVFLSPADGAEWLKSEGQNPADLKNFLLESQAEIDFKVAPHRDMKPGWEKRK